MNLKKKFITLLQNKNSLQEERIQALFQLMNIGDKESLEAIIKTLENDPCEIVRHEAAFVLGETAAYEHRENLRKAIISDPSGIVKHEAILALGTIANEEDIPFLEEQKQSKVKLISESAKIALQRIKNIEKPYRGPEQFSHLKT
ncbi:MAG: HEAT repeat domain-containing protein [Candidatus Woesearchaeota archaeon]|nr:HEAT repeat domain-containing protein [Nanoarchaeota archaeon]USN44369.1 MAG: HEAT repeat domain-containing protein [Candidatus Woesearchaeota archaeon]